MKKRIAVLLIVLSVVITGFTMEVMGKRSKNEKDSLKGITTLRVLVADIKPEFERDVVKKSTIQTDVELKLRMAGIKVVSEYTKVNMAEGSPWLYIILTIGKPNEYQYIYSITVELKQTVRLYRTGKLHHFATTWDTGFFGLAGIARTSEIRDIVKDHVDIFINDYLEMNPKE